MEATLQLQTTITSKGQVTLPAAFRADMGLSEGMKITVERCGHQLILTPELPVSAYRGILRHLGNINTDIPKEPDRF
jgi:AbrB family looped-hinge helix DNA binding protein